MALLYAVRTQPHRLDVHDPLFRILIVEDEDNIRRVLTKLLEIKVAEELAKDPKLPKVEVVSVSTLAKGLEHAASANCTILDLTLPDSDSENTRAHIPRFRPPVIVTTGDADPQVSADCLLKGAEHVFIKGQINGLVGLVLDCLAKDFCRINDVLVPHGEQG